MKALILGAKGMLGSMLTMTLEDRETTAWDREDLDITDEADVRAKVIKVRPEVILNAAAYTDVDGAEDPANKDVCFAVNEIAVGVIGRVAAEIGATVVHYSTDYVFPGQKKTGYAEYDAPGPAINIYGQAKLAGERALKESGATFYLLRSAWLYGPNGKNFVETMLKLAETKDALDVVDDQHGSPTFTKDLAGATREVLENQTDYRPGIYHGVNAGQTTWAGFARKIFELAEVPVEVQAVSSDQSPRPAQRPKYSRLKNTRGPEMRHWEDALADYLRNYRE